MDLNEQIKYFLAENIDVGLPEIYRHLKFYSRRRLLDHLFSMVADNILGYNDKRFFIISDKKKSKDDIIKSNLPTSFKNVHDFIESNISTDIKIKIWKNTIPIN